MASTTETIILDFQVEAGDAVNELEKTKKAILQTKEAQKELNDEYKTKSKVTDDYAARAVKLEQDLKKQTATYSTLTKVVQAQNNSLDALTAANKKLRDERNKLDLTTESGSKRLKAINKEIDKNTEVITKNVSKLEQQKINIGNYSSALDGLVPGFSQFSKGIEGTTAASKAFIATPLGAVIGAIGLAVSALTAYFKGSEEGQNRLNKLVQIGTTIFEKFMDVVEYLGEKVFDGLAKGIEVAAMGFDKMAKFLGINTQIVKDFFNEVDDNAKKFYETEKQIAVQERSLILQRATTAKEVAKLREQAISQDGEAKKKTIEQAIALEKELSASEVRLAKLRETLAAETVRQRGDDKEAQMAWVEATAERIGAEAQAYEATLRFQKELEKIRDAQTKQNAVIQEALNEEIRLKNNLIQINERLAEQESENIDLSIKSKMDVDAVNRLVSSNEQKWGEDSKELFEERKQNAQTEKLLNQQKLANASTTLGMVKGLLKEESAAYKTLAISQASIDTYRAASAALAPPPVGAGPLFGPILAATTIALGLANIAKIAGFAEGGYTGHGKRDEVAGVVHKGEVVFSQRDVSIMGGPQRVNAMRPTFKGYADGGIVTAASTGPINQSFAFRSAMDNQPTIVASWKEATELNARVQFKESLVTK